MDALLNRLCETPGVSGRERQIRAVIREIAEATGFFDEIREDVLGNLLCLRHGQGVGVAAAPGCSTRPPAIRCPSRSISP